MPFTGVRLFGFGAVNNMLTNLTGDVDGALAKGALLVESDSKRLCAVDTGRLRSSIHSRKLGDKEYLVGSAVRYAPFVEYGTYKMRAQPFLRPSLQKNLPKIKAMLAGQSLL